MGGGLAKSLALVCFNDKRLVNLLTGLNRVKKLIYEEGNAEQTDKVINRNDRKMD